MLLAFCGCAMQIARGPIWKADIPAWPARPWPVVSMLGPGYQSTAQLAVNAVNGAAGCELFRLVDKGGIIEIKGDPEKTVSGSLNGEGWIFVQIGDIAETYLLLQHELGHLAGLAHQSYGIMNPTLAVPPPGRLMPSFDEEQREALRQRWCR